MLDFSLASPESDTLKESAGCVEFTVQLQYIQSIMAETNETNVNILV